MKIDNWCVVYSHHDQYTAPERITQHLNGNVSGHPLLPDGKSITTTAIVGKMGDSIVTKSGSIYELGQVLADYESAYPDAKLRLLATLPDRPYNL